VRRDDHSFGDYLSTFPSHRETDMILSSDRLYVGTISTLDRSDRQIDRIRDQNNLFRSEADRQHEIPVGSSPGKSAGPTDCQLCPGIV